MNRRYLALFFLGIIVGSIGGIGAIEQVSDRTSSDVNQMSSVENQEDVNFATPGIFHANIYNWGVNKRKNITSPARIRQVDYVPWAKQSFIDNRADMVDVDWLSLDEVIAERPDARILPYQVNVPNEFKGIYVSNDSRIDGPKDLEGKTVSIPGEPIGEIISAPAKVILKKEHGVDIRTPSNLSHNGPSRAQDPVEILENEEVDAVLMTGTKRLGDNHSLRPVFLPFKEMEEKFGDSALITFFVVENDSHTIDVGFETLEVLQESSKVAQAESDEFMDVYEICNEFMVQDGREQIERMSPEAEEQLQYFIDAAYEQGYIDRDVNISDRIVRKEK